MSPPSDSRLDVASRVLELLDRGSFVATYKYAVLLGLLDLCLERSRKDGEPPKVVTTRQLAERVLELYWLQARDYPELHTVLKQNSGRQAKILQCILKFQAGLNDPGISAWKAQRQSHAGFARLLDQIEWTLVEMPLPKLQRVGSQHVSFLYDIGWDDEVNLGSVRRYQRGNASDFDNRIHFKPGVAAALVALNGLLRPFIHREWCSLVASLNDLQESKLVDFLFGVERTSFPKPLRQGLLALQDKSCFYCRHEIVDGCEIDHFIPWVRFPTDAVENLVAAHDGCNGHKRDHLASPEHLRRWWDRCSPQSAAVKTLNGLAELISWPTRPEETRSVCRALYHGTAFETPLWVAKDVFLPADPVEIARSFT